MKPVLAHVLAVVSLLLSTAAATAQAPVSYDEFMRHPAETRVVLLQALSKADKAVIFTTHLRRWRDQHSHRLSREQKDLVEERICLITEELSGKLTEPSELSARFGSLQRRTAAAFSSGDQQQLFHLRAHIPATIP